MTYLITIQVLEPKIIRSRHRNFLEVHLWSLPIVALIGMIYRLYGTLESGVHVSVVFSLVFHLLIILMLFIGCVVERIRKVRSLFK